MSRDYAKRYRHTHGRTPPSKPGQTLWTAFAAVCLVLVLAGGGISLLHHRRLAAQHRTALAKTQPLPPAISTAPVEPTPRYDFYTLLPKAQVETAGPQPPLSPTAIPRYALQVAAVKTPTDADRLKAQLSLLGFDVIVEKAQELYRISVGPYASLEAARNDQIQLRKNNINSVLKKLGPPP